MGVVVGNTNFGMRSTGIAIGEACNINETENISLASMLDSGGTYNGLSVTFGSGGGAANAFEKIGGSNNPLQSTGDSDVTTANLTAIGNAPFHMSHCIGGEHEAGGGGGPGQ